ncbi:hypothetical protein PMAYCL1PPCAC_01825 [Pristionchus mayeri]|uniref:AMP-activated protein kinase glycogen-binding domain-containing protein n=1 Tax=Pristionchus mayeri TaxID=1317129 RepID=A0AAN4Z5K3_9BILA|nr:hypothetical protein PMAYCL1PPCAC_01825 [Pristionchus mayeri]
MAEASAARPAKGWLRLLIESVDVPLDHKEPHRLLFSTVQSLIPGAHGLYYRGADGARKALTFDGAGNVNAPDNGWDEQNIFVHLAHGHRPGAFGCGGGVMRRAGSSGDVSETSLDAYTMATDRFEKTVSLVQKMMTASSVRVPRKSSRVATSLGSTSEEDSVSNRYKEENDGLRKRVSDLEGELAFAQNSMEELKNESGEMTALRETAANAEERLAEAERTAEATTLRASEAEGVSESERVRADKAEWSLGEHRAWLNEAKTRSSQLEAQLVEAHCELSREQSRADKAEWTLGEHITWLGEAKAKNEQLERALSSAQDQISELRDRAEKAEWNFEEQALRLAEEREKTRAITAAAESATTELRERVASIESELCCHREPPVITPAHVECDTTVASGTNSEEGEERDKEEEQEIEEEPIIVSVVHQQAAAPSRQDTVEMLETRVCELEAALEESRKAVEAEFDARLADVSRRADESLAEVVAAKKRYEEESAAEVITKIQELTEKEDELNNLHSVIEDLREKLKSLERARADAEWHLGEHRDWLKNERDKVAYLEEQLRRVNNGTSSRPVSRKNSTESGFGGSTSAHPNGDDSGGERKGSESPPAPAMMQSVRKMKFTATSSDDLAAELMALSKDKQRMAVEIRELKARPDPTILEAERRAFAETVQECNERCARLEAETAHFKDIAARVNMDEFNAKDERISELQKVRAELEWALGEKTQEINDAKWRIGELDGQCAHLKSQPLNCEAIEAKERDLRQLRDEKAHLSQQLDNARWRLGELEAECSYLRHSNSCNSSEKEELERLRREWNDQKWRIGELESGYAHHEWQLSQAPSHDELRALRDEKSKLEHFLSEARRSADDAKWRVGELEAEIASLRPGAADGAEVRALRAERDRLQKEWHDQRWRIGELESGYTHHERVIEDLRKKERREDGSSFHERELEWKLGEAHKECENLRGRIGHLESELGRREAAAAAEKPGQLEESLRGLRTEKDQLERRVRELDQMYNDTKWRNGELEAGLAHAKWMLDEERMKVTRLEDCSDVSRDGSFVVRHRRPGDARLWQLAMRTSKDDTSELRAVTLTIDEPSESDAVFLIGSFSTWECCARITRPNPSSARRELTVHLPRGRHEFRFIVDGGWANSTSYPTVPNPFGTANNWISVE